MNIGARIKQKVQDWLEIQPSIGESITIQEVNSFQGTCFRNLLWYRGDPAELHQYYTQVDDLMGNAKFWSAVATTGIDFRKIHTGLPGLIIDMLADIVIDALNKVEIKNNYDAAECWKDIQEENDFKELVKQAIIDVFIECDGAFKISYDTEISKYPIIQFYSGLNVNFRYRMGRLDTIVFKNYYNNKEGRFLLEEFYSKDGVKYKLLKNEKEEVPLDTISETKGLQEVHDNGFRMAIPMMINKSKKFVGRGQSIIDKKIDDFDSYDEVWSQWIEAIKKMRQIE